MAKLGRAVRADHTIQRHSSVGQQTVMGTAPRRHTHGGPLLLVPGKKLTEWHGSHIAGRDGDFVVETQNGPFAFRTDYDFEKPRTDYERACQINGLVGQLTVDGTVALVLNEHPL